MVTILTSCQIQLFLIFIQLNHTDDTFIRIKFYIYFLKIGRKAREIWLTKEEETFD